ncbi:unnamed protein product [Pedinophyceae sp. YPF-701]|nr:unnamed protein product [Pedinophyceae sp. YPF-701]
MTDQPGDAHMAKLRQTDATPTLAEGVAQAVRSAAGAAPAEAARADSRAGSRRSSIGQRESKGDAKAGSKGGESAGAPKGAGGDGGGKKAAQDERQGGAQPPPDLANMSKEERRAYYAAQRQQGALDTAPRKPQTKAERRALQEAQKAAKAAARAEAQGQPAKKGGSPNPDAGAKPKAPKPPSGASTRRSSDGEAVRADAAGAARSDQKAGGGVSGAVFGPQEMFAHLQPFDGDAVDKYILGDSQHSAGLPPEVLQLAMQYRSGAISGANARCVALLHVLRGVIASHVPSSERQIGKHLTDKVNRVVSFLVHFRPLSVSMGNAVRWLKLELGKVGLMDADEARAYLVGKIDTFIAERVEQADEEIVAHANDKIVDGDVILTHAYSHAVLQTLLKAKECGKKFRVVVVDSRPLHEGQRLLRELLANGIPCMFTHIGALNYIMGEATKTFLGAAAVLANGAAVSRVGTAAVAMISQSRKVPVLIFAETYKFHERIQLDSIISNELGDPKALLEFDGPPPKLVDMDAARAAAATPGSGLTLLNLTYDLMPADLITFVVTEYGLVPPTSVPVILREYRKEFSLTT